MRHTFPLTTDLFFVTSSLYLSKMLVIHLFCCVQDLTTSSGVLTCLNYLYMPCVLITVKPNNTCLAFFSSFLLFSYLFPYKLIFIYFYYTVEKVPRIRNNDWQYCCCQAAQRWRWHDTAPWTVFLVLHSHITHPFLICWPWLATSALYLSWMVCGLEFCFYP